MKRACVVTNNTSSILALEAADEETSLVLDEETSGVASVADMVLGVIVG